MTLGRFCRETSLMLVKGCLFPLTTTPLHIILTNADSLDSGHHIPKANIMNMVMGLGFDVDMVHFHHCGSKPPTQTLPPHLIPHHPLHPTQSLHLSPPHLGLGLSSISLGTGKGEVISATTMENERMVVMAEGEFRSLATFIKSHAQTTLSQLHSDGVIEKLVFFDDFETKDGWERGVGGLGGGGGPSSSSSSSSSSPLPSSSLLTLSQFPSSRRWISTSSLPYHHFPFWFDYMKSTLVADLDLDWYQFKTKVMENFQPGGVKDDKEGEGGDWGDKDDGTKNEREIPTRGKVALGVGVKYYWHSIASVWKCINILKFAWQSGLHPLLIKVEDDWDGGVHRHDQNKDGSGPDYDQNLLKNDLPNNLTNDVSGPNYDRNQFQSHQIPPQSQSTSLPISSNDNMTQTHRYGGKFFKSKFGPILEPVPSPLYYLFKGYTNDFFGPYPTAIEYIDAGIDVLNGRGGVRIDEKDQNGQQNDHNGQNSNSCQNNQLPLPLTQSRLDQSHHRNQSQSIPPSNSIY